MTDRDLFGSAALPEGFDYRPDLLSPDDERRLIASFEQLPFKPFDFHGFVGKRRIVSYGFRYDYSARRVRESATFPSFLNGLRVHAGRLAAVAPMAFQQVLVTEYTAGAGIGWHKDKPDFGQVVAFSFASACTLRFRCKTAAGWERRTLVIAPRSAYVLRGAARWVWEHSIPPQPALRYSVTLRTFQRRETRRDS
jgi:alkylated DNA repair dioxygenase AlkB